MAEATLFCTESFLARAKQPEFISEFGNVVSANADASVKAIIEKMVRAPALAQRFYQTPLPDVEDIALNFASGIPDITYTLRAGLWNALTLDSYWRKHRSSKDNYRVLDFGCGSGRIMRYPAEFGRGVEIRGCDVNEYAVRWIDENFPCRADPIVEPFKLDFIDEPVDLIYAWSIFTHFAENEHLAWLDCLAGKLTPGGVMLLTYKPLSMVDRIETDPAYRKQVRAENLSLAELKATAKNGFLFYECYDPTKSVEHGVDPVTFGNTFISEDYISRVWSKFGDIVEFGTAAKDFQDLIVLRKR